MAHVALLMEKEPGPLDVIYDRWSRVPSKLKWEISGDTTMTVWIVDPDPVRRNERVIAILPKYVTEEVLSALVMAPEDVAKLFRSLARMRSALQYVLDVSLVSNDLASVREMVKMTLKEEE